MKRLKISLLLMVIMILSVSAVSAVDDSDIGLESTDIVNDDLTVDAIGEDLYSDESDDVATFTQLNENITNAEDTLTLDKNYKYSEGDVKTGIVINKDLTIDGDNHYIDGAGVSSIFKISQGKTVTLKNIIFKNASSASAGCVIFSDGKLVVDNCQFDSNDITTRGSEIDGGVIAISEKGTASIKNSNFTNNIKNPKNLGNIQGGAIGSLSSEIAIENCIFLNNSAYVGGAIMVWTADAKGKATIINSTFEKNYAFFGGAIFSQSMESTTISKSKFNANSAYQGGAISADTNSPLYVTESSFSENNVTGNDSPNSWATGAAIYAYSKFSIKDSNFTKNFAEFNSAVINYQTSSDVGDSEIDNCIFEDNVASSYYGAFYYLGNNNLNVNNSKFINNNAKDNSGALFFFGHKIVISNTEFENNKAGAGGAVYISGCEEGTIDNCTFDKNSAKNANNIYIGAADRAEFSKTDIITITPGDVSIKNSKFLSLNAEINAEDITVNEVAKISGNLSIGVNKFTSNLNLLLNDNAVKTYENFAGSTFEFNVEDLKASQYQITFNDSYGNKFILASEVDNEFKVKKDNKLNVTIEDVEYPNTPKAIVLADVDGEYKIKIGDSNYTVEVKEGKGEVPIQRLPAGDYTATLTLSDEDYTNLENTTTFKVNKGTPEIKVIVINATDKTNATVKVTSSADGNLTVKVNGTEYKINNAEANKEYSVVINILPAKEYEVEVNYAESDNYLTNSAKSALNVLIDSQPPQISFDDINPGNTGSVTVPLPENASGEISVIVDGKVVGTVKANGTTTVDIPAVGAGNHNIEINYTGDDKYGGFKISQSVNVASLAKLTGNNVNAFYDDGSVYKVQLLGDDGKPASGADVVIKVNGKKVATLKTDKNGYVSYKITQTPKASYTITAEANGLKATNKLVVKQIINAKKTTKVKKYRTSKIKITLKAKKVLKNKKLTIKFKGKKYTVKTNKKGVAYFKVKKNMVNKLKKGKKYSYTISYKKDTLKRYVQIK